MPGVNCAIVSFGTSRRTKRIGIFKLRTAKNDKQKSWKEEWLSEITKTRVIDKGVQNDISVLNDTVIHVKNISKLKILNHVSIH